MSDVYKAKYEALLEKVTNVANNWDETEKQTGDVIWGECASDLQTIIEDEAEQM